MTIGNRHTVDVPANGHKGTRADHWSSHRPPRHAAALRLVSRHGILRTDAEDHESNTGRVFGVETISLCAGLVSLVAILLCLRCSWTIRRSRRTPRRDVYEDAMSTTQLANPAPSRSAESRHRTRLNDYEEAKPIRDSAADHSTPPPNEYHEPEVVITEAGTKMVVRHKTDSQGYTQVDLVELDGEPTPARVPAPSEYNRLRDSQLHRTMSAPARPCKAYNHVMLVPEIRAASAGGEGGKATSMKVLDPDGRAAAEGGREGGKQQVTSHEHQYDVSGVALMGPVRVAVIDSIYHKLENAGAQGTEV